MTKVKELPNTNKHQAKFTTEKLPDTDLPIEDIIEWRKRQFLQKSTAKASRRLIDINVNLTGVYGIIHMGDPHVDDDGCNLVLLEHHMNLSNTTPNLMAGNVGDLRNNWIGRLARLYGNQGTTAKQARMMIEWFMRKVNWLYIVNGNHDCWSGSDDPIKWLCKQLGIPDQDHGIRLNLKHKRGRDIRINCRHDFAGHSQWNPAHGVSKAAQMGWRDHILVCGHKHVFGYNVTKDPITGMWSHALRVGTYKVFDEFADAKGFPDHNLAACVTIIDPNSIQEEGIVTVIMDVDAAADWLHWANQRQLQAKSVEPVRKSGSFRK